MTKYANMNICIDESQSSGRNEDFTRITNIKDLMMLDYNPPRYISG